jgi:hypothetical protein
VQQARVSLLVIRSMKLFSRYSSSVLAVAQKPQRNGYAFGEKYAIKIYVILNSYE